MTRVSIPSSIPFSDLAKIDSVEQKNLWDRANELAQDTPFTRSQRQEMEINDMIGISGSGVAAAGLSGVLYNKIFSEMVIGGRVLSDAEIINLSKNIANITAEIVSMMANVQKIVNTQEIEKKSEEILLSEKFTSFLLQQKSEILIKDPNAAGGTISSLLAPAVQQAAALYLNDEDFSPEKYGIKIRGGQANEDMVRVFEKAVSSKMTEEDKAKAKLITAAAIFEDQLLKEKLAPIKRQEEEVKKRGEIETAKSIYSDLTEKELIVNSRKMEEGILARFLNAILSFLNKILGFDKDKTKVGLEKSDQYLKLLTQHLGLEGKKVPPHLAPEVIREGLEIDKQNRAQFRQLLEESFQIFKPNKDDSPEQSAFRSLENQLKAEIFTRPVEMMEAILFKRNPDLDPKEAHQKAINLIADNSSNHDIIKMISHYTKALEVAKQDVKDGSISNAHLDSEKFGVEVGLACVEHVLRNVDSKEIEPNLSNERIRNMRQATLADRVGELRKQIEASSEQDQGVSDRAMTELDKITDGPLGEFASRIANGRRGGVSGGRQD